MMISDHFSRLKFFFKLCTTGVASDGKSSKQESKLYMLTDASLDPGFISYGFSTSGTCSISVEAELPLSS